MAVPAQTGGDGVASSPDGNRLATGGADRIVQVYAIDIYDLMELPRHRVSPNPFRPGCKEYLGVDKCQPVPDLPLW